MVHETNGPPADWFGAPSFDDPDDEFGSDWFAELVDDLSDDLGADQGHVPGHTEVDPRAAVAGLTRAELVSVIRDRQAALVAAELAVAAAMAAAGDAWGMEPEDAGDPDAVPPAGPRADPRAERFRAGPDGMPTFSEFAGAEIAPVLKMSIASADHEIRTMLVLRHRHPRMWQAVLAGELRVWQAKKVIGLTGMASLSLGQVRWLDE